MTETIRFFGQSSFVCVTASLWGKLLVSKDAQDQLIAALAVLALIIVEVML